MNKKTTYNTGTSKLNGMRIYMWLFMLVALSLGSCESKNSETPTIETPDANTPDTNTPDMTEPDTQDNFLLPDIDLSNWKVTLPIGDNGRPIEVEPPEILDYANNETLLPFMYNDSVEGALVFYAYPGVSTPNSSKSRTELREQLVPGSNNTNWTFAQGGRMKGTLAVTDISKDTNGNDHRVIIMQIHGRLTDAQRDLIGEDDNNAPPVLKIYWQDGKIRVKTKQLKNSNASEEEILHTTAWEDDEGHYFSETVGSDSFTLEILASEGRLEVIFNESESAVYEGIHMDRWGVFENYFKAGNYLQSSESGAFARIKYYDLEVFHE